MVGDMADNWFDKMLNEYKDDLEFRFEGIILDINEKICKRMKEKKVKRADLAKLLGVSRTAVTNMLDGNPNFTLKRLLAVTDALDMNLVIELESKSPESAMRFESPQIPNFSVDSSLPAPFFKQAEHSDYITA